MLRQLKLLNLSGSDFSDGLPDFIGLYSALEELWLSSCKLTDLPLR